MSTPPVLDARDAAAVEAGLWADTPGFTPEWSPRTASVAGTVVAAYAHGRGLLNAGLAQLPQAQQAAMLDMLGAALLPAQGARVPLVFSVSPQSVRDITLAQGSQVAAIQAATLPSLEPGAVSVAPIDPPVFTTERSVTLTPGKLLCLASIDAGSDAYADHSCQLTSGFTLFTDLQRTPHELYLGHDTLFAIGGDDITLIVGMQLLRASTVPLVLAWEYLAESGWLPLPHALEEDTTTGLTSSGQVTLRRVCGPNAKKDTIAGHESFWIRARLDSPLTRDMKRLAPIINDVRVRVMFGKTKLLPEAVFADAVELDASKHFWPFGERPVRHACFYLGSKEVFGRPGATIRITFNLATAGISLTADSTQGLKALSLAWDYFADQGWKGLGVQSSDGGSPAKAFTFESPDATRAACQGTATFTCPDDWAEGEVNGVKQRWMRVRIADGAYGSPASFNGLTFQPEVFNAPVLAPGIDADGSARPGVGLDFHYLTDPAAVQHCLVRNDFRFEDATAAALWPDQSFQPFSPIQDESAAVHFGFDRTLPGGLGSLFVHCPASGAAVDEASPWQWEYSTADGWRELGTIDETAGFQRSGMIQFIGPRDAVATDGLNGTLYRIRARLKRGENFSSLPVAGVWINAAWAVQQATHERELLGRSEGMSGQRMAFARAPVLEGEVVEVEEWVGRGDTWRLALADVEPSAVRLDRDPVTGEALTAWVRWAARPWLHDAGTADRVYTLERATGVLRFGVRAPVADRRVVASYRAGGGLAGNVPAGSVTQMRMAQPLVTAVTNPVAASAGADVEPLARALLRGPQALRHRQRALSSQDIEWLAHEASPEVARVRCLPLQGPDGRAQRGHYTVLVAPYSTQAQPMPAEELARRVQAFLAARAPATARIRVVGPRYLPVSVRAVIVPLAPDQSALVEERARAALDRFLHPVNGGTDGQGWQFGQAVALSRVASLLEGLPGVSHAQGLVLSVDGALCADFAAPGVAMLPCAGTHELVLRIGGGA